MPFVYIHGVRQRSQNALDRLRGELRVMLDPLVGRFPELGEQFEIETPYWGKFGVVPRYNDLVLPFRVSAGSPRTASMRGQTEDGPLQVDPLDTLRGAVSNEEEVKRLILEEARTALEGEELAEFERLLAADWEDTYRSGPLAPNPDESPDAGMRGHARDSHSPIHERRLAGRIVDMVARAASRVAVNTPGVLGWLLQSHYDMSQFMGDAMVYVQQRERYEMKLRDPALGPQLDTRILDTIVQAVDKVDSADDPLIVMTHSMGGSIFHDVVAKYLPKLRVTCWISVGSQVSQFASLGLLAQRTCDYDSDGRITGLRPRIGHWWNVYDSLDPLNYRASGVFADAIDHEYRTARGPTGSHSGYFNEQDFYQQVGDLIAQSLALRPT